MPEFRIVRTSSGSIRGVTQDDEASYRKFQDQVRTMEAGEYVKVRVTKERNPKFNRKFFALLNVAFEAWEPGEARSRMTYKGRPIEKSFEQFRKQVLILAGHYEQTFDLQNRLHLEAKSISFAELDDDELFADLYERVLKVLLKHVLTNYTRDDVDRVVAQLQEFG